MLPNDASIGEYFSKPINRQYVYRFQDAILYDAPHDILNRVVFPVDVTSM